MNDTKRPGITTATSKDDIAVWRPGAPDQAAHIFLNGSNGQNRCYSVRKAATRPSSVSDYISDKIARCRHLPLITKQERRSVSFFIAGHVGAKHRFYAVNSVKRQFLNPGDFDGDGKY